MSLFLNKKLICFGFENKEWDYLVISTNKPSQWEKYTHEQWDTLLCEKNVPKMTGKNKNVYISADWNMNQGCSPLKYPVTQKYISLAIVGKAWLNIWKEEQVVLGKKNKTKKAYQDVNKQNKCHRWIMWQSASVILKCKSMSTDNTRDKCKNKSWTLPVLHL